MFKKSPSSRFAEVFLSMGIPAIGYIRTMDKVDYESLAWQIPVILLAAWHVIIINDSSFGRKTSLTRVFLSKKNITGTSLFPIFILPALYMAPLVGIFVFLTIINWDIYSIKGKRNWVSGLFHNFAGGALHFIIGIACSQNTQMGVVNINEIRAIASCWPEILFFGSAMMAGAIHHDSFDADEDKKYGYITGAVKFSPDTWWRIAIIPFLGSLVFLTFSRSIFRASFIISSVAYLSTYTTVSLHKHPASFTRFRSICRLSFVAGAFLYLYFKIS